MTEQIVLKKLGEFAQLTQPCPHTHYGITRDHLCHCKTCGAYFGDGIVLVK